MAAFTGSLMDTSLAFIPQQSANSIYGGSVCANVQFVLDPNQPQRPAATVYPYSKPTQTTTPSTP